MNDLCKKFLVFIMSLTLVTTVPWVVNANTTIAVTVNNNPVIFLDVQPVIVHGRTLVPMRGVFEHMGFNVDWNEELSTATLTREHIIMTVRNGDAFFILDGTPIYPEVPPQIVNNRFMLPLRAIAEATGADVGWDESTRTILISTDIETVHIAGADPPQIEITAISPINIAESIIRSQGGIAGLISISYGSEYFIHHISEFYRMNQSDIRNGIIFFVDFSLVDDMPADEIAVFELVPTANTANIADALRSYIRRRASEFAGYAPESAAVASRGIVVYRDNFIALIICYEPQIAESAFLSFFR